MNFKISEPGVYAIANDADYHADPCPTPSLSSSIASTILERSPLHGFWDHPRLNPAYQPATDTKFDIGTAAHDLWLRGEGNIAVIDADDFRGKAARYARTEAYLAGKTPLLGKHWQNVKDMVESGKRQLALHKDASGAFLDGKPQVMLAWREGPIWCRCLLDWCPNEALADKPPMYCHFYDLKSTTNANPRSWVRTLYSLGKDVQEAFYRRGIREVLKIADPQFRFVVQEIADPFGLSVCALDPKAQDIADDKVEEAIATWAHCLGTGKWHGYGNDTYYLAPPGYVAHEWEDRKALGENARGVAGGAIDSRVIDDLGA